MVVDGGGGSAHAGKMGGEGRKGGLKGRGGRWPCFSSKPPRPPNAASKGVVEVQWATHTKHAAVGGGRRRGGGGAREKKKRGAVGLALFQAAPPRRPPSTLPRASTSKTKKSLPFSLNGCARGVGGWGGLISSDDPRQHAVDQNDPPPPSSLFLTRPDTRAPATRLAGPCPCTRGTTPRPGRCRRGSLCSPRRASRTGPRPPSGRPIPGRSRTWRCRCRNSSRSWRGGGAERGRGGGVGVGGE
jgi:hypothetical protein